MVFAVNQSVHSETQLELEPVSEYLTDSYQRESNDPDGSL